MENKIIGRQKELTLLKNTLASQSPEFVAIYGRRRVGKTYLIKNFYCKQSGIFFELTGLNNGGLKEQLKNFSISLSKAFYQGAEMAVQKSWMDALRQLNVAIENTSPDKQIMIFFDEIPWLATRKSGFLKALEYYWNTQWSHRKKLILIVCGSAASWMLEKIVYSKGGLHNRITVSLPLQPFDLKETKEYLKYKAHNFENDHVLLIYMVMGGIPHYLNSLIKNISISQNIDAQCFQKGGLLFDEFEKLFHSLYEQPEIYIKMIRAIAKKSKGVSREEVIRSVRSISDGGHLNVMLKSLEEAGFISSFLPLGHTRRGVHYRLIDEYVLFYLKWIEPFRRQTRASTTVSYWPSILHTPVWYTWAGHAFEAVCLKHVDVIKNALDLKNIQVYWGDWRYIPNKSAGAGAQIDLVLDRSDNCVTLCEIKYTEKQFKIAGSYKKEIDNKEAVYKEHTRTKKQILWCFITNNGLYKNSYANDLAAGEVILEDFFK